MYAPLIKVRMAYLSFVVSTPALIAWIRLGANNKLLKIVGLLRQEPTHPDSRHVNYSAMIGLNMVHV